MHKMNMKLFTAAAGLSSLLVTSTKAFSPISSSITRTNNNCHKVISTCTVLSSYLDNLSNSDSSPSASESPSRTFAASSSSATYTIPKLNLDLADALSNGVIAAAKRNNFAPIVVSILDKQANMLVQKRMDGDVHAAFPEFSYAKAFTCVTMNVSSREFQEKYTKDNDPAKMVQVNSMMAITGKMAAFPGGVVLRNGEGEVIGAIGVSGAAGDEDEYAALRGVWDTGLPLVTQPVEHSCATVLE